MMFRPIVRGRRRRFRQFLYLCAAILYFPATGWAASSHDARLTTAIEQRIVIHGGKNLGATRLRHGFLHGITYARGKNYSKARALISDLKPKSWRLSAHHNNVYAFVVAEAKLPQTLGMEVVFNIQDVFHVRHGYDLKIRPFCLPRAKNCFSSYDSFKQSWLTMVNHVMKLEAKKKIFVDYFEIFSEPFTGSTRLGLSPQQFADIFRVTHDTVRRYRPNAKIIAPSIVAYRDRVLETFLLFVIAHNLRVDAVSWHEFEIPEALPLHVKKMREFFAAQPRLCNPTCPEIHINEYARDSQHLVAGYGVGWLYYLERAGVDHANRACWDVPQGGTTCWSGINGMLMQDNATPQALYWVYKAYADMNTTRVVSESSARRTVALASKDDAKREYRILVGRYGQKGASGKLTIELTDYLYDPSSVKVEIMRFPNTGNTMQPSPRPPSSKSRVLSVRNKSVSIVIDNFRDGEAGSIVVRPGGAA